MLAGGAPHPPNPGGSKTGGSGEAELSAAPEYAELHCHSSYSLLDGASQPEELVAQAQALGLRALALTDHDGLYIAPTFCRLAEAAGIQPIVGAELTLSPPPAPPNPGGDEEGVGGIPPIPPPGRCAPGPRPASEHPPICSPPQRGGLT